MIYLIQNNGKTIAVTETKKEADEYCKRYGNGAYIIVPMNISYLYEFEVILCVGKTVHYETNFITTYDEVKRRQRELEAQYPGHVCCATNVYEEWDDWNDDEEEEME